MTEDYGHPWLDDPAHSLEMDFEERDYMESAIPKARSSRLLAELAWEQSWPEVPYKGVHRASELDEEAA